MTTLLKPLMVKGLVQPIKDKKIVMNDRGFVPMKLPKYQSYSFDLTKAAYIYEELVRARVILPDDTKKMPKPEEFRGKKYCKLHYTFNHSIANFVQFRDWIQVLIVKGKLLFEKPQANMMINTDPFPEAPINMINLNWVERGQGKVTLDERGEKSQYCVADVSVSMSSRNFEAFEEVEDKEARLPCWVDVKVPQPTNYCNMRQGSLERNMSSIPPVTKIGENNEGTFGPSNFHLNMTYVVSAMFCAEPNQPTVMKDDYVAQELMMTFVNMEEVKRPPYQSVSPKALRTRTFSHLGGMGHASYCSYLPTPLMTNQKRKDQVIAVRSLIKRLLNNGRERRKIKENSTKEMAEWGEGTSGTKDNQGREILEEEVKAAIHMAKCIYDLDWPEEEPDAPKSVEFLFTEPDKLAPEVQDPLETINFGTEEDPRPIQLSGLLEARDRAKIVDLLYEFKDCFVWHYIKIPRLDSNLVEHIMPIKEGNINEVTPKDEYTMPMADLSIDGVAKHKVLSFMNGNAGYNQIKMAKEDIHKTSFRYPWHVEAYEYIVMPFGLKNAEREGAAASTLPAPSPDSGAKSGRSIEAGRRGLDGEGGLFFNNAVMAKAAAIHVNDATLECFIHDIGHLASQLGGVRFVFVKQNGNATAHAVAIKEIADALTNPGAPVDDSKLIFVTLHGLPLEYDAFVDTIHFVLGSTTINELHGLLLSKEIQLANRKKVSPSVPFQAYNSSADILPTPLGDSNSQLDVSNAFLHGNLTESVFMVQPSGFEDPAQSHHVYKLHKSMYGLKQAPRAWYAKLTAALHSIRFSGSQNDHSLFVKKDVSVVYVLVYVNDILVTRPDSAACKIVISQLLNLVCHFMQSPRESHFQVVKRIFRYLKGHISLGLWFPKCSAPLSIHSFLDAEWAGCTIYRRSTGGFCIFLGDSLISWSAKKQPTVARSSTKAEYQSLANTVAALTWICKLLVDIGLVLPCAPKLWCDNISAISLAKNPLFHAQTKNVEIDYHYIREKVLANPITMNFFCT
ncbi:hypothetical protein D8674_017453 [Pyrus ussuriensis x Pyrus communis]|uniref:Reverse transcriptase Ty1/copia-type domain-containing protein n=1 Tax=Pyrus ussuriensis x Pyrus communis TaxID=2448454 RepID=A0A5N5HGR7_9ROSA|nr:hypothetical protein D8674_017453 [Pyrus ussuriensis x Pyrus communis]